MENLNKTSKWKTLLINEGFDQNRKATLDWLPLHLEMVQAEQSKLMNENYATAYASVNNAGLGNVSVGQLSTVPGALGTPGTLDITQQLVPLAMKIAAQTIGLELVTSKPVSSIRFYLPYADFVYDDVKNMPLSIFTLKTTVGDEATAIKTFLTTAASAAGMSLSNGFGNTNDARLFVSTGPVGALSITSSITVGTNGVTLDGFSSTVAPSTMTGVIEFLGFSRIDGTPIFGAFRQVNDSYTVYNAAKNSFTEGSDYKSQITKIGSASVTSDSLSLELTSVIDDHLPGYASNNIRNTTPMSRAEGEDNYVNNIGTEFFQKEVVVGTINVGAVLRREQITDIKTSTGMDLVSKMESMLINHLSLKISRDILSKIYALGKKNRDNVFNIIGSQVFDFNTAAFVGAGAKGLGGENTDTVLRNLLRRINNAANFIKQEGRLGLPQYILTDGKIASALQSLAQFNPGVVTSKFDRNEISMLGTITNYEVFVDQGLPYAAVTSTITLGRRNKEDEPGILFCPYLMAQAVSIIAETTMAPKLLLSSRYAITEVGFYPEKQFLTLNVTDAAGILA